LNQGLDFDEKGFPRKKKEQFTAIAWGFFIANVFAQLTGSASKTLFAIATYTNKKFRNTTALNPMISECAGLNEDTVKKCLRELEYYHFIERHDIPGGSRKKRKRVIVLHRWDTAKEMLIKENKIKVDTKGKVYMVIPNPFRK
jgi:hypothetical protein